MLSRIIAAPFLFAAILLMFVAFRNADYAIYIVPNIIVLAVIYVLHPQIDWWWYQKHPPKMDKQGQAFLERFFGFYQALPPEEQLRFRNRTMMIQLAKDFMAQADDKTVPADARLIFAACQAQLTFGMEDYLLESFEKVVIYPDAFPSPKYPEHFHLSEVFEEDTVNGYIFSLQHMLAGFTQPNQFYNITSHELSQSLTMNHPDWAWPAIEESIWIELEQISQFPTQALKASMNRPDIEPLAATVTHFLTYPAAFQKILPGLYEELNQLLKVYT
ncbi:MAG: hypothetical protein Sapg2KO_32130 [Saprospiraceae bacterium]